MRLQSLRARTCAGFTLLVAGLLLLLCIALGRRLQRLEDKRAEATLHAARTRLQREWNNGAEANAPLVSGERLWRAALGSATDLEAAEDAQNLALLLVRAGRVFYRSPGTRLTYPLRDADDWKTARAFRGDTFAILVMPRSKARSALRRQYESLGLFSFVVLLGAAVGSWLLVGRTLSPIGRLSRQVRDSREQSRASGHGGRVRLLAPSADAEIVELVGTLNDLLARAAQNTEARGRFYAAASHELRTPLQALTGHLDLALGRERAAPELRVALQEAQTQATRLASLVSDLLRLNQLEMATTTPPVELVDLADFAQSALRPLQSQIEARGLQVQLDWPANTQLHAPVNHLEMLLRNLLENAVKYARAESQVRVGATRNANALRLEVFNECDAPEELETDDITRWFEPFYRPDAARRSQTGGSGLGLAICRALADANNWQLSLAREPNGVRAIAVFPKSNAIEH